MRRPKGSASCTLKLSARLFASESAGVCRRPRRPARVALTPGGSNIEVLAPEVQREPPGVSGPLTYPAMLACRLCFRATSGIAEGRASASSPGPLRGSKELSRRMGPRWAGRSVGAVEDAACAAIRAGISRPAPLDEAEVLGLDSATTVPLTGHPITPLTDGFVDVARWVQMAVRAFADLVVTHPPGRR